MKLAILTIGCFVLVSSMAFTANVRIQFDQDKPNEQPKGFVTDLSGKGKPGKWVVIADASAPSKPSVLAQLDSDSTSYRFPVCVYDQFQAQDVLISVRIKPVSGSEDQAAGIVLRYKDANNYYIVRANALEDNVVLYKVQDGKRTDLPLKDLGRTYGKKIKVPSGQWSTLSVKATANLFEIHFNGPKLFEVEDSTFPGAGKIGLWTKADSVTYFDDLLIETMK
ncbi:hypothetical protein L0156_13460 [bacterium]|nr:hypothetical protein [bacterium]